jgi:eukaryotic-like serine/threonine-protein kinase
MADHQRVRTIFLEAVEQHAPEQWSSFLDQACAGDQELRQRVEALLRAHVQANSMLDVEPAVPTIKQSVTDGPGMSLGPYKLLEQIGEGGFGVVFLAEQQQPVRRKVAVKILKPGMDTRQVVARFEAERQALAIMDDPHIAKIFDGGVTSSGRPYFVMELVKGVPITEFCDDNCLTPRQRLELFLPVCRAVQHAHQKGIIHRDLKPSNILVSRHDTTPVVKVIDFGIAKALGQELTDKTLFTRLTEMIGTPLYMSPEQAGMSDLDVDTRSDIYSLGVLLYELLTGTTPFTKERFKKAAYEEIRRIIREEEPPKPSTRLSESKDSLPSISASRQTEPAKLTRLVRGELDWIVMKALEKDRNRRYETANGFAMDIQRYLADEPVQACPPSASYRLRKLVRRNRKLLVTAAVFSVLLVLGVIGLVIGLIVVDHQRRSTAEERDLKDMALQGETRAREAERHARTLAMNALRQLTNEVVQQQLARRAALTDEDRRFLRDVQRHWEGFAALSGDGAEQRAIRAEGYLHVASVRDGLGEEKEAQTSAQMALALYQGLVAEFPEEADYRHWLARSHNILGQVLMHLGRWDEAEKEFAEQGPEVLDHACG